MSATIIPFPGKPAAQPDEPCSREAGQASDGIAANQLGRLAAMHERNMLTLYGEQLAVHEA